MSKETKQEAKAKDRQEALEYLRGIIKPNDTIYTTLDHVSASGMTRHIGVYIAGQDKKYNNGRPYIQRISWYAARILDYRQKDTALIVGGVGMDMGYHVVHSLARSLFPAFRCTGKNNCPSNDHINGEMNPASEHKGELHSDGGYSLRHEWL